MLFSPKMIINNYSGFVQIQQKKDSTEKKFNRKNFFTAPQPEFPKQFLCLC